MISLQEPYQPRPIRFLDLWQLKGWRLKAYGIAYKGERPRRALIEAAQKLATEKLDQFSQNKAHYYAGFVGIHDGRGANFVFIDFWADENELHHHVYISPAAAPAALAYVTPTGLIACVWDLSLMSFERQAWVKTVLANPAGPDVEQYLTCRMNEDV